MGKYRALAFDLNFTLLELEQEYPHIVINEVLRKLGRPERDRETVMGIWLNYSDAGWIERTVGVGYEDFFRAIASETRRTAEKKMSFTRLYPDVDVIGRLAERYGVGIVTGNPPWCLERELELFIPELFRVVISAGFDDGVPAKPHPRALQVFAERMGCGPGEVLMVGDGPEDRDMSEAAGSGFVYMDRGERNIVPGEHCVVYSLHELDEMLKGMEAGNV